MKSIAWIIGAVVAFMIVRYAAREGMQSLVKSVTTDKAATCLSMLGNTTREEDRFTYIVGSVKNKCDQKFGSVTITFKLDRQSGSAALPQTLVPTYGSSKRNQPTSSSRPSFDFPDAIIYAYIRDLKPGETREFKSALHIPSNSTYRFDAIRAY